MYLRTWAAGGYDFNVADRNTLEQVAVQNPVEGGRVVLTARVMLDTLIDDPLPENNARMAGTENNEIELILVEDENFISKMHPNPNSGIMQLEFY